MLPLQQCGARKKLQGKSIVLMVNVEGKLYCSWITLHAEEKNKNTLVIYSVRAHTYTVNEIEALMRSTCFDKMSVE